MQQLAPRLVRADSVFNSADNLLHSDKNTCGEESHVRLLGSELLSLCRSAGAYGDAFQPDSIRQLACFQSPVPRVDTMQSDGELASEASLVTSLHRKRFSTSKESKATIDPRAITATLSHIRHKEDNVALRRAILNHPSIQRSPSAQFTTPRRKQRGGELVADAIARLLKRASANHELQAYLIAVKALLCTAESAAGGATVLASPRLRKQLSQLSAAHPITPTDVQARRRESSRTALRGVMKSSSKEPEDSTTAVSFEDSSTHIRVPVSNSYKGDVLFEFIVRLRPGHSEPQVWMSKGNFLATNGVRGGGGGGGVCVCTP